MPNCLISDDSAWQRIREEDLFDIPMGSFHGAEVCDLVGLYILSQLNSTTPQGAFGLYRDDGLGVIKDKSSSSLERITKRIRSLFKDIELEITIEAGGISTNFLDVTLNLNEDTYCPYRKPNTSMHYINRESNHPPHVVKALPTMIVKNRGNLQRRQGRI